MSQEHTVYDLGEIDFEKQREAEPIVIPRRRKSSARLPGILTETVEEPPAPARVRHGFDWRGSLSLVVPGSGTWLRGDPAGGLFHLCSLGFVAVLSWSLIHSMHRIVPTLELLEHPRELGFWMLGGLFAVAAAIYLSSAWRAVDIEDTPAPPHPFVAGAASFLVPGWGQVLNGDRFRAICFIAGLWVVLAAWILSLQPTVALLRDFNMYLPAALRAFSGPAVRYTLPAVIWTLSVYDAVSRAQRAAR